jgi:hypothetical protein
MQPALSRNDFAKRDSIHGASNKRLERTRHERACLVSCVGEPLKRSVMSLAMDNDEAESVIAKGPFCFSHLLPG